MSPFKVCKTVRQNLTFDCSIAADNLLTLLRAKTATKAQKSLTGSTITRTSMVVWWNGAGLAAIDRQG